MDRIMGVKVEVVVTPEGWKFATPKQMAAVLSALYTVFTIVDLHIGPERVACFVVIDRGDFHAEHVEKLRDMMRTQARNAFYAVREDAPARAVV